MPAPTFVSEQGTAPTATNTQTLTLTGVTTGDLVLIVAAQESGNDTWSTISGGGLTWTQIADIRDGAAPAGSASMRAWTATASATGSLAVTVTKSAATNEMAVRGSLWQANTGVGATATTFNGGSAPSLALTTTLANSSVCVAVDDWNAVDGATRTWRAVNGTTPTAGSLESYYFRNASRQTIYAARYPDAGAPSAVTVGLTAPTGQRPAILALEILGTASGGLTRSAADTIAVTDQATPTLSSIRSVSDTIALADTASTVVDVARQAADAVTVTDAVQATAGGAAGATDAVAVADTATATLNAVRQAADTVALTDAASTTAAVSTTPADTIALADTASTVVDVARQAADAVTVTDAVQATAGGAAGATDAVAVADTATATLNAVRQAADTVALTDAASTTAATSTSGAVDVLAVTDAVTVVLTATCAVADVVSITDAAAVGSSIIRIIAHPVAVTDAASTSPGAPPAVTPVGDVTVTLARRWAARTTYSPAVVVASPRRWKVR